MDNQIQNSQQPELQNEFKVFLLPDLFRKTLELKKQLIYKNLFGVLACDDMLLNAFIANDLDLLKLSKG